METLKRDCSTMSDYIYETPNVILNNVNNHSLCSDLVSLYTRKAYKQITFVASGSSYTAIQCARFYISRLLKVNVNIVHPYTFTYYDSLLASPDDFIIIVSQSGASTNCIKALQQLQKLKLETIVLTANENSDCANYADHIIDWKCGIEKVGYVTLGVVSLIVYLQLFAAHCAKILWKDEAVLLHCQSQIRKAMEHHREICKKSEELIVGKQKDLMEMDRVYILGCGSNYGTALEGALKIGETTKVLAVAYELDEFLHGPALQLSPKYHIFIIDSNDETSSHALEVYHALRKVSNHVYLIGSNANVENNIAVLDATEEPFTCLYHLAYFELIADRISTQLNVLHSHPLYYEMNKVLDFRTASFREHTRAEDD